MIDECLSDETLTSNSASGLCAYHLWPVSLLVKEMFQNSTMPSAGSPVQIFFARLGSLLMLHKYMVFLTCMAPFDITKSDNKLPEDHRFNPFWLSGYTSSHLSRSSIRADHHVGPICLSGSAKGNCVVSWGRLRVILLIPDFISSPIHYR